MTCSENRYGEKVQFNHPFFQAAGMFLGELLCLFAFRFLVFRSRMTGKPVQRAKPHSRLIFWLPAFCDMTGTSLMYVGLTLTDASIFQMLRGSIVVFTAILSVVFLKARYGIHKWIGIALVIVGTLTVGLSSFVCTKDGDSDGDSGTNKAMLGNFLIIIAQVIGAVQMVVEEKFISGYDVPPLEVVGWEGFFGLSTLTVVLTIMYHIKAPSSFCPEPVCGDDTDFTQHCDHFEDSIDAFTQMKNSGILVLFILLNVTSIAFFNFLGVSITKHINASTRMVLDSLRTVVIWAFSLLVNWESFCYVQVIGFAVVLLGTLIFNDLIKVPGIKYEEFVAIPDEADDEGINDSSYALLKNSGEKEY